MQEPKKINRTLKCLLTEDESREMGGELAQRYSEITDLEDQKKAVTSDFKSRIDAASAEASRIARMISNGYEFREVECEVVQDYEMGEVLIVRLDTGETIERRRMTPEERQVSAFAETEDQAA